MLVAAAAFEGVDLAWPWVDAPQSALASAPSGVPSWAVLDDGVSPRDWGSVMLHHSATDQGSLPSIDAAHRRRTDAAGQPWLGIGYHFVIGNGRGMPDGQIEPTFRWRQQLSGAHAGVARYNEEAIGVCLIGDFNQSPPTARQMESASALVGHLARRHAIPASHLLRHQDVRATDCPGRQFPWQAFISGLALAARGP